VWYPKEVLSSFTFSVFDELYTWVKQLMDAADKSKLVRLKVIYGQTGYTSLPKYSQYTFIESMEIPADKTKIKELGIDLFKRPALGDKEVAVPSAASAFGAVHATPNPSEVPF